MRKIYLAITVIVLFLISCVGNQNIPQAKPFENILQAMTDDSDTLFKNSFSTNVQNQKNDSLSWPERLLEAKDKFQSKFNNYSLKDFTYGFSSSNSKLIVSFKGKEMFRMNVISENGVWKLDEH